MQPAKPAPMTPAEPLTPEQRAENLRLETILRHGNQVWPGTKYVAEAIAADRAALSAAPAADPDMVMLPREVAEWFRDNINTNDIGAHARSMIRKLVLILSRKTQEPK